MDNCNLEIGKRIKRFRKGKMTQKELADKIGKAESSIRKYEKGLVTIPLDVLQDIAAALDISPSELMKGGPFWEIDQQIDTEALSKEVKNLSVMRSYLEELGYVVKETSETTYLLTQGEYSASFTNEEYRNLQKALKNAAREVTAEIIEKTFYKKVLNIHK
ncbi:MAG: helix-turn-helix domain-containing protein [Kineothrix sp.]|nr:helix-turn-helix domain-containing protein [Kineothrix sp.]